jgi:predicted ribonuclease YlaK
LPKEFSREKRDNQILAVALQNSKNILVSKDIALRVAATALGIKAEDYKTDYIKEMDIFQNEIDQYSAEDFNMSLCTIKPKNNEQVKAFKILQEKEKKLIAFVGIAGSGKSLIALAYAIEKIAGESKKEFQKLIVMRPTISVGKEIGFLPGDLDSKMEPWIQPIYDATKILLNDKTNDNAKTNYLFQDGTIEVIPISFIRGRSLNNSLIYIDECMLPDQLVNINGTSEKLTIKEMFDLVESEDKTFFVPSYNLEKEEVETNRIVAIKRKPCTEKVYKITLENGKVLKLTENHKLYVKNKGYTKISEITREDILFEFENEC